MLENHEIGHVQLMMIPDAQPAFEREIEVFEPYSGNIRIHAPHHTQRVNPCAPGLFTEGISGKVTDHIERAMYQTYEAADRTGSDIIVLHAGRYLPGEKAEAIAAFHDFLDRYPDTRYVLESLPDLTPGPRYLGITPDELHLLGGDIITGYCPDFPHLWCTSVANRVPFADILAGMDTLPIRFSHLSGSPGPQGEKQHLLFDDPDNRFCLDQIRSFIQNHPSLEISLEFGTDDTTIIRNQLRIISAL